VKSIFHIFLTLCRYRAINGLAARVSPGSTPLAGSVDSSQINTRTAPCTRLAYILLRTRIYMVYNFIPYTLLIRTVGSRGANSRALCLSRTSRRLTGINPGEMTRLIKQIGQNIIGSVVRPRPSRKHCTVRLCTPSPQFPTRALDGLNERVRKY